MRYKDKVSDLLGNVENKINSLKNGVQNNAYTPDELVRQFEEINKTVEYIQGLVEKENWEMA